VSEIATIFGIATIVIFVGFLSSLLFEKTKVPDILILIVLGVVIGPLTGIINPAELSGITELFGALALALILFEGGLELKFHEIIKKFGNVMLLMGISFTFTMVAVALAFIIFLPTLPIYLGLALGALLSAISAPIVIPILSIMKVKSETKALLNLESALTDSAAILVVFLLLGLLGPLAGKTDNVAVGILATILFSTVIAVLLGIGWLEILKLLKDRAYSYMITLAVVLGLYSIVEFLGGTGPVAALVFGIVLSNGKEISQHLPIKTDFVLDERLKRFHSEITFFLKTFFFVYVGIIFSIERLTLPLIIFSIVILVIIIASRVIGVKFLVALRPEEREDQDVLLIMMPRGLTSVVLASILAATAIEDVSFLVDVAFTAIILTNVLVTAGVFIVERRRIKAKEIPPKELEAAYRLV